MGVFNLYISVYQLFMTLVLVLRYHHLNRNDAMMALASFLYNITLKRINFTIHPN